MSPHKVNRIRLTYNMTEQDYYDLLESQGGRCAICGTTEPGGRDGQPHIDHDHNCCPGVKSCGDCIRGILCHRCNLGLGNFRDSIPFLRSAANYLRTRSTSSH